MSVGVGRILLMLEGVDERLKFFNGVGDLQVEV